MKMFIHARTPGADPATTVEWAVVKVEPRAVMVDYEPRYSASRWVSRERKRPFRVSLWTARNWRGGCHLSARSFHRTLEAAIKSAAKIAKDMD